MTKEDITNKILNIVSSHTLDKVKMESTRYSLGLDSLDQIGIIMYVEEEFDIEIPDYAAEELNIVGDLVNFVWGKVRLVEEPIYFKSSYGYIYMWEDDLAVHLESGTPLYEAECLKKLLDFSQDDINNGRVSDMEVLKNKLFNKKKSAQKKKSKESQWTHTISERKFNRCVDQYCVNIQKDYSGKGLDIYYNPETNTIYRGIYACQDDIVFVAKHLDKCKDENIVDFYQELYFRSKNKNIPEDIKNSEGGFVTLEESRNRRETKTSHKSDGGKSKYYEVVLPDWLLDKHKNQGSIMLEDLAEIMFGNDFNYTNIFKAQKRMYDLENGGGKEGNTFEYDATKCKYYVDKQVEVFNRRVK